jgi:hypothetical protein
MTNPISQVKVATRPTLQIQIPDPIPGSPTDSSSPESDGESPCEWFLKLRNRSHLRAERAIFDHVEGDDEESEVELYTDLESDEEEEEEEQVPANSHPHSLANVTPAIPEGGHPSTISISHGTLPDLSVIEANAVEMALKTIEQDLIHISLSFLDGLVAEELARARTSIMAALREPRILEDGDDVQR